MGNVRFRQDRWDMRTPDKEVRKPQDLSLDSLTAAGTCRSPLKCDGVTQFTSAEIESELIFLLSAPNI